MVEDGRRIISREELLFYREQKTKKRKNKINPFDS
jgi:hypothetical protein